MRRLRAGFVVAALVFAACGSGREAGLGIPPLRGNDTASLADGALTVPRLVTRAAGELEAGRPDAAELWVRRALVTDPEDAGGLAVLARIAAARGDLAGAREVYRMLAAGGRERAAGVRKERLTLLLKYAKAELAAGRVFTTEVVVREADAMADGDEGHARGELHRLLAEVWTRRGLVRAAREEITLAEPHGVDLDAARAELAFLETPSPAAATKVGQAIGARAAAEWLFMNGAYEEARKAATQAVEDDAGDGAAQFVRAFAALALGPAELSEVVVAASAAAKAGIDPQRVLWIVDRVVATGHTQEARQIADAVSAVAPGHIDAALRSAGLAVTASDAAAATQTIERLCQAAPDAWEAVLGRWGAQDAVALVALKAALATGHVTRAHEARLALATRLAKTGAPDTAIAAIAALAVLTAEGDAVGQDIWAATGLAQAVSEAMRGPARAELERWARAFATAHAGTVVAAVFEAWLAEDVSARSGLAVLDAYAAAHPAEVRAVAYARALFEYGHRRYPEARTALEQAMAGDAAPPGEAYRVLGELALRLAALEPGADERAAGYLKRWLAGGAVASTRLEELARLADGMRFPRAAVVLLTALDAARPGQTTVLADLGNALIASAKWQDARGAFEQAIASVEADPLGRGGGPASARTLVAVCSDRMRTADRGEEFLALLARLHPAEIDRLDLLPDLAMRYEAAGQSEAADLIFMRLLAAGDDGTYASTKVLGLAEQLLELRRFDLARRAFARAVEGGDRTMRAFVGWMRAIVRATAARAGGPLSVAKEAETRAADPAAARAEAAGDGAPAGADADLDEVINRWFESRPKRDDRAREDAASQLREEGALGRARQIYLELAANAAPDVGRWGTVVDLFRRLGDGKALAATLQAASEKQRWAPYAFAQLADRLAAIGEQDAAEALVRARNDSGRDPVLLTEALTIALMQGDAAKVRELAAALYRQPVAGPEVWERGLKDIANAGFTDVALGLIDQGIERFPRASKLLLLRARWLIGLGRFEQALADLGEAIARAPAGEDMTVPATELLRDAVQTERLVGLLGRSVQGQSAPRSEAILGYARALIDAGRPEEAEQELVRALGDSDRGQAAIADVWFDAREPERGLRHAERGVAELPEDPISGPLGAVTLALVDLGAPRARIDMFVRLGVQAGADALAVGLALWRLGLPRDALPWLERAFEATSKPEVAQALARARLATGDRDGALAAYAKVVAAKVAEPLPSARPAQLAAQALAPIVSELVQAGEARRAAALVGRMEARYGRGTWLGLLGAYAAVEADDWADALARLTGPFEPWRGQREVFPTLQLLLTAMCAHGHAAAAADVLERALAVGTPERDMVAAAIRVGARAGRPELAWRAALRLRASMPSMNTWLVGEALAAARMPKTANALMLAGWAAAPSGAALGRAAVALALGGGLTASELARAPSRVREDRGELANVSAIVEFMRGHWAEAARALLPTLDEQTSDLLRGELPALAASLSGDLTLLDAVATALGRARTDRVKLRGQLGARLAAAGQWAGATRIYAPLTEALGGSGAVALPAIEAALAAGDDAAAEAWSRVLTTVTTDGGDQARLAVAQRFAMFGRWARAQALLEGVREQPAKARVAAMIQAGTAHDAAAWARFAEAPLATNAERAERAELALGSPDAGAARAALAVLTGGQASSAGAAGRDDGREVAPSQAVLELQAIAAWRAGDLGLVKVTLDGLEARAAMQLMRGDRLVAAALEAGDAAGLERVLAWPGGLAGGLGSPGAGSTGVGVTAAARQARLANALIELGGAVDRGLVPVLERWALAAPAANADAVVLLDDVAAAEALSARAPWEPNANLYLAWTLLRHGQAERAAGLARAALERLPELGLFDLEARPVAAPSALAARILGEAELAAGRPEAALAAFDRSLALGVTPSGAPVGAAGAAGAVGVTAVDGAVVELRARTLARLGRVAEAAAAYRACGAVGGYEAWARRCRAAAP